MFKKLFLPVGILLAVVWSLLEPTPGLFLKEYIGTSAMIVTIFLISGMQVSFSELPRGWKFPASILLGCAFTLIILPLTGYITLNWIPGHRELLAGLMIMLASAPTLSSGTVLTKEANGNMMFAIAITVFYNMLAILTLPLVISFLLGRLSIGNISTIKMFWQLISTVLLPLILGYFIRKYLLKKWNPTWLGYIPLVATITLSWAFFSAARSSILAIKPLTVLWVLAATLCFHLFSMAALLGIGKLLKMSLADCKAMIFCGASKSGTIALAMVAIAGLGESAAAVPCLLFYALSLFVDALLAGYARSWVEKTVADKNHSPVSTGS